MQGCEESSLTVPRLLLSGQKVCVHAACINKPFVHFESKNFFCEMGDEEEECKELQTEEIDVLKSIYEGDSAFTIISDTKFQYKMGNTDSDR